MMSMSLVIAAARTVRVIAVACAVGLVVGYIAISSFSNRYGASTPMVLDSKSNETALSTAIAAQKSAGLTCSEKPTLTDVILFQRDGESAISVMTFDEAIKASSAQEGWIRRYCV